MRTVALTGTQAQVGSAERSARVFLAGEQAQVGSVARAAPTILTGEQAQEGTVVVGLGAQFLFTLTGEQAQLGALWLARQAPTQASTTLAVHASGRALVDGLPGAGTSQTTGPPGAGTSRVAIQPQGD
jgi:hypothetical protein